MAMAIALSTPSFQSQQWNDPHGTHIDVGTRPANANGNVKISAINGPCKEKEGKLEEAAFRILPVMNVPDSSSFASLLQSCADTNALSEGKQVHARMLKTGDYLNHFLRTKLFIMYCKCGSPVEARVLFDNLRKRDVFSWRAMMGGYSRQGMPDEVLELYYQMRRKGVCPDKFVFPIVIKACAALSALQQGRDVHDCVIRSGIESDVFVGSALVHMYAKCGSTEDARQVFDKMPERDYVSWNAMVACYARNEREHEALELFRQMQLAGVAPNSAIMASVLSACARVAALQQGKEIHGCMVRSVFELDVLVGSALVDMYAKCRRIDDARQVFDGMSQRNVVSWNAMIAGYVLNGCCSEALKLFSHMERGIVKPNSVTFVSVLQACTDSEDLEQGRNIHDNIIRSGFASDVFVLNALVNMYAKCGSLEGARQEFDKICQRDIVSWNVMIVGCIHNGHCNEALKLFRQMQLAAAKPNLVTILSILPACAILANLAKGKEIHGYGIRRGLGSDVFVESALVDMYAKCGSLYNAQRLFDKISERDVVSWTAMIAGYARNGHGDEAMKVFRQMQLVGLEPNPQTIVSVIPACAQLATLQHGKEIHSYTIRKGFELDVFMGSALVDMYAKCGTIMDACQIFDKMSHREVVAWNSMIVGYAMHGHGKEALMLFHQMQEAGVKPNNITFAGILSACNHAGLVDDGRQYFDCMSQDYCLTPDLGHYACMVDLLGRSGCLDEAHNFIKKMPLEPNACVWGALLSACRIHGNIELGERVAGHLFELEPENPGNYVLLSNIYAAVGMWDGVAKVRKMMKEKGLRKKPGCSWIEVKNRVHSFLVGDKLHPQTEKIYAMLESLAQKMEAAGFVSDPNFVLHDVVDEEKEYILCEHSEKLAVAFGLINTGPETPVRVIKNLRVCGDCHTAIKFISKIVGREIFLRDTKRFHHFKNGVCSCGDYW